MRVGVEALEAGAHHPPLDALLGDLYWWVFKRLYPARVPANRQIQALATDMLKKVSEHALQAIAVQGKRLSQGGDDAPPLPIDTNAPIPASAAAAIELPEPKATLPTKDPWLETVLAYCGPDAEAPDADHDGVASQLGRRLAFLKDVSLFQDVPGIELLGIAEACEKRSFKAQTAIFNEGDFGDSLYIVVEGVVNIVRGNAVINTLGPARCLGEIAIIDRVTRIAGAVCASDVTVYRLSADKFRAIVKDNGAAALGVMRVLAQRLHLQTGLGPPTAASCEPKTTNRRSRNLSPVPNRHPSDAKRLRRPRLWQPRPPLFFLHTGESLDAAGRATHAGLEASRHGPSGDSRDGRSSASTTPPRSAAAFVTRSSSPSCDVREVA